VGKIRSVVETGFQLFAHLLFLHRLLRGSRAKIIDG